MLVLSRKNDEAVVIGGSVGFERMIKVTVVGIKNGHVRLGFEADADVPVNRLEVWERIRGETELVDSRVTLSNRSSPNSGLLNATQSHR
jgi:carbon storage regulator CsrA